MTVVNATATANFVNSIGINTHIMYTDGGYADYQAVIADLNYLGITHVRDMVQNLQDTGWGGWHYDSVANAGIKFDFFFQSGADWQTTLSRIDNFVTHHPGAVLSIEGPNEIDSFPVTSYNGKTGLAAAIDLQSDIYAAIKADPLLKDIPVANFSLSTGWSGYVYQTGDMSGVVDYGNVHQYFDRGDQPGLLLAPLLNAQSHMTPGMPMIISETGYHTAVGSAGWPGVDEATQAKLTLNLLFDAFKDGSKATYLYQLLDAYADPAGTDQEKHFGLFDIAGHPKDAAVALHNLTSILADGAVADPSASHSLDLGFDGLPTGGNSLLLQKASGAFDVVVWAEPDIWNETTKTAITVPSTPVTVSLGAVYASIKVFDPLAGTDPVATYENVDRVVIGVTDHPLIVEVSGNAAGPATMLGTASADMLDDNGTACILAGGTGDDVYRLGAAGTVVEEHENGGNDRVIASASHVLEDNVEELVLGGNGAIDGTGNALDNLLTGNDAANILDGGAGADRMAGLGGDDTYVVDNLRDVVTEAAGGGTDTVRASVDWTLGANLENLVLTGAAGLHGTGNALANHIDGTSGDDWISGGAGADTMAGGGGDDVYVVDNAGDVIVEGSSAGHDLVKSWVSYALSDNVEDLTLVGAKAVRALGNALDNHLIGSEIDNLLDGGAGDDTLEGGRGDDIYVVDSAGDTVIEAPGAGYDTVRSSVSHTLDANVEALTLTGTGAIDGTGNALANVLTGNAGNNVLDGSAGADRMAGGLGDDTYVVDNARDAVVEQQGGGYDTVEASVSFTLSPAVEALVFTGVANVSGTGNGLGNAITGNAGNNVLDGRAGDDTLEGGAGSDTLIGGDGHDTFVFRPGSGADTIRDFHAAAGTQHDTIRLVGGLATFADVAAASHASGRDVVIDLGPGDTLTLKNVALAALSADDFAFG